MDFAPAGQTSTGALSYFRLLSHPESSDNAESFSNCNAKHLIHGFNWDAIGQGNSSGKSMARCVHGHLFGNWRWMLLSGVLGSLSGIFIAWLIRKAIKKEMESLKEVVKMREAIVMS